MFDLYTIFVSIILGIIQGITEFLPISSTGHIIIISHWLKIKQTDAKILEIFIQLGSGLATLYFFRKIIFKNIIFNNNFFNKKNKVFCIFISILPTIFVGLMYCKKIKTLFNTNNVVYSLIIGSFFLLASEILKPKQCKISKIDDINFIQSIIIGLFQVFSLYPGFSRSGATIATAMILGIKKSVSIEFSFIISIPLTIGASLFDLFHHINEIKNTSNFLIFFIGFMSSFLVSLFSIKTLLNIINKTSFIFFGIYRLIVAILVYFIN